MTVSSVDLGSVCASLMDISLQLLASVKSLERSLSQVSSCAWLRLIIICSVTETTTGVSNQDRKFTLDI